MSFQAQLFLTPIEWVCDKSFFKKLGTMADDYLDILPSTHGARAFITGKEGTEYTAQVVSTKRNIPSTSIKVASLALFCAGPYTVCIPLIALGIKVAVRHGVNIKAVEINQAPFSEGKSVVVLTTRQFASPEGTSESDSRYAEIFRKKGLDYSTATALQKHVAAFTDDEGNITRLSIEQRFLKMKISYPIATIWPFGIYREYKIKTQAPTEGIQLQSIHKAMHCCGSQVFTANGDIDNGKLDILKKHAKTDPTVLTEKEISGICASFKARDVEHEANNHVKLLAMLLLFSDRIVVDESGNKQDAISIETLEKLYKYGPFLFDQLSKD